MVFVYVYNTTPEVSAQSKFAILLAVSVPLLMLMNASIVARLVVRGKMLHSLGNDDFVIAAAGVSCFSSRVSDLADTFSCVPVFTTPQCMPVCDYSSLLCTRED